MTIAWEALFDLSHIEDPAAKMRVMVTLNELEASDVGQAVFEALDHKLSSPTHEQGVFQHQKVAVYDGDSFSADQHSRTGELSISLDMNSDLHVLSLDGELFVPAFDTMTLHEIAHLASTGYEQNKRDIDAKYEALSAVETQTRQMSSALYDTESDVFAQAPPEIQNAVLALQSGAIEEVADQNELRAQIWDYRDSIPEYAAFNEQADAIYGDIERLHMDNEDFSVAVANLYRLEKGREQGMEDHEVNLRGHYLAHYYPDDMTPEAYEAMLDDFHVLNEQWVAERGAPPTSVEALRERYADVMLSEEELQQQLDAQRTTSQSYNPALEKMVEGVTFAAHTHEHAEISRGDTLQAAHAPHIDTRPEQGTISI